MLESDFVHEVEMLARSEAFDLVLRKIEEQYVLDWRLGKTVAEREKAHAMISAMAAIRVQIESIATDKAFNAFNRRKGMAGTSPLRPVPPVAA